MWFSHGGDDGYAANGACLFPLKDRQKLLFLIKRQDADQISIRRYFLKVILCGGLNFDLVNVLMRS